MTPRGSVLVSGASSGIGAACVTRLARAGYRVFAGVRRPEDGERIAAAAPDLVQWLLLDVTDQESIATARERIEAAPDGAGLAGLVNNAGVAVGGPLEYVTPEELERQLEINVVGLHAVTQAMIPLVRKGQGRIVHMGSISGRVVSPFLGPYAASKHAVEALASALRLELAQEGIRVSVIEPGPIRTAIWEKGLTQFTAIAERVPADGEARYRKRLRVVARMLERIPRHADPPEAVAEAVLHALEARRPRRQYVVGRQARARLWLSRLLPASVMDALILAALRRAEARIP